MSGYLDDNGLRYLWTKMKNYVSNTLSTKVDKVTGKDLSSNDFTTAYKEKLDGIDAGANNYTLPTASSSVLGGVKVGSGLSIDNGVLSASSEALRVAEVIIDLEDMTRPDYRYPWTLTVEFPFAMKCCFSDTFSSTTIPICLPGESGRKDLSSIFQIEYSFSEDGRTFEGSIYSNRTPTGRYYLYLFG